MMPLPPPVRAGDQRAAGLTRSTVLPDIDFETYSEAGYFFDDAARKWRGPEGSSQGKKGLPVIGAACYAMHPSTEILSLAWNLKDGTGPQLWRPGDAPPQRLLDHVAAGGPIEAWNCAFEWWIWNHVARTRHQWPELRQDQLFDAMAKARAHALPGALAEAGKVLAIQHQKDADGDRLLKKFSMPRNPSKADPTLRTHPIEDPADAANLYAYNLRDIVAEAEASALVPDLCDLELAIWRTDQKINRRGIAIDLPAVDSCIGLIKQAGERYGEELKQLAGCYPTELQQLKGWLHGKGVHMDSMDEEAITGALDGQLPEECRRALEIRAAVGSASVKKVFAMRNQVSPLGRLHDLYTYHGARTGRPTGNGPQPTNLPKAGPHVWFCASCGHHHNVRSGSACPWCFAPFDRSSKRREWNPEAMEDALQVLAGEQLDFVEWMFTDAMLTISGVLRGLFVAAPGKRFISSDFSAIEGVVIAALAGEQWRLDVFRGHGKIYEMSAAKILGIPFEDFLKHKQETGQHHPARQNPGKIAELGLGFGGWINAWKQFGGPGTDDEIKANIIAWREASPAIVHLWGGQRKDWKPCLFGLEGAVVQALQNPGREVPVDRLDGTPTGISYLYHGDALYARVPSGGLITYHRPRLAPAEQEWRGLSISFEGWNTNPKSGPPGWIRMNTYSGKLAENCVQRVARDIQMHAIEQLEAKGYPIVMHTYDEVVAEVPDDYGTVEELEAIMADLPAWAAGWPIKAAGGWVATRYRKG